MALQSAVRELIPRIYRSATYRPGSGRDSEYADTGGDMHEFLAWLTARSRRLHYSVGFAISQDIREAILNVRVVSVDPRLRRGRRGQERPRGLRTSPACGGLAAVDVSDFAGDLGIHSDSAAGVFGGQ
jgi:hypothetical protein